MGVDSSVVTRLVDGGLWMFDLSGAIVSIGDVWYQDDQCAGTAYSSGAEARSVSPHPLDPPTPDVLPEGRGKLRR